MISKKQFLTGSWKKKDKASPQEDYLLAFMRMNKEKAYTALELSKAVKKSESMIRDKLSGFVKKKLVTRDSPYYIYGVVKVAASKKTAKKKRRVKDYSEGSYY